MSRKPEQIVEDQVKAWSYQQKGDEVWEVAGRMTPVVTISRETATPGRPLAERLGARTGFSVWDKELLQAVALDIGGDEKMLTTLDEHRRSIIDDTVRSALLGVAPTHYQYLGALMRIIRTIASHGKCIIVGRGAQYICDPKTTLRVRLVAPVEHRIVQYAATNAIDEKKARIVIEQADLEQDDFIRYHFRREIGKASDYDLVLNSVSYTVDQMTDLVLNALTVKLGYRPHDSAPVRTDPYAALKMRHSAT